MTFLAATMSLAEERGYLPLRSDTRWLQDAPEWLNDLQTPDGLERLAVRLGTMIPGAVREFWSNPALVRLLDSWRWQDYLVEEPRVFVWRSHPHLLVCSHPHSGGVGGVLLNGSDDPPMFYGWEEEEAPIQQATETFSDHVHLSVERGPD